MPAKKSERTCEVCGGGLQTRHSETRMHRECVGVFNSSRMTGMSYPSPDAVIRPTHMPTPIPHLSTIPSQQHASKMEQLGLEPPPRPLDDPRNITSLNNLREKGDFWLSPISVAVFDLETTGLNAGYGVLLCGVIDVFGGEANGRYVLRADNYEPWKQGQRSNDGPLLGDILSVLSQADILIAHNGLKFDVPFLRTRAIIHGYPPIKWQKIYDPRMFAFRHFSFPGNSLDSIAKTLQTEGQKMPLGPEIWQRVALDGDPDAMNTLVERCISDVEVLTQIVWKIRGYVKQFNQWGSF